MSYKKSINKNSMNCSITAKLNNFVLSAHMGSDFKSNCHFFCTESSLNSLKIIGILYEVTGLIGLHVIVEN